MAFYPALIHRDEGTAYGVSFPDFPGTIASNDTIEAAMADAESALVATLETMHELGRDIPEPSSLDVVTALEEAQDAKAIVLVEARYAEPTVRVNTTIPASLVARIDREALRRGMSRSAFLSEAARAALRTSLHDWEAHSTALQAIEAFNRLSDECGLESKDAFFQRMRNHFAHVDLTSPASADKKSRVR